MIKIEEIFKSWVSASNPTKEEEELALKRHSICLECKWITNSLLFNTKCGECGCPIDKKIFSPVKGACRIGKWDDVDGVVITDKKQNKTII
jgi:hypothetical protein